MIPGLLRLLLVHVRRYSTEPETRPASADGVLNAAIALHVAEHSLEETALAVMEAIAVQVAARRLARRSA